MMAITTFQWIFATILIPAVMIVATENYNRLFGPDIGNILDPGCQRPLLTECNSSVYPMIGYTQVAWFFYPPIKACQQLYTAGGFHDCYANKDLPLTKEYCEQLCAEHCKMDDGSDGICMFEEHCDVKTPRSPYPNTCGPTNIICCPRQYETYMSNNIEGN